MRYAKFWAAVVGGAATSGLTLFGADTTAGKVLTIVVAACTAVAVYMVRNDPAPTEEG